MIEGLHGITETIDYGNTLGLILYHNTNDENFPEHWHTGMEIIMPVHAEYTVYVGKEVYRLQEGDFFLIGSGILHRIQAPPAGERIIMQFNPMLLYTLEEMETLLSMLPPVFYLKKEDASELYGKIKPRMDQIVAEYDSEEMFSEALIYAELLRLFVDLGNFLIQENTSMLNFTEVGGKQRGYLEVMMKVCNYINLHYLEKLTLEDMANLAGFSKFHFTRVFKKFTNMTFCEYVNRKRVEHAEGLLYSTNMSIIDVAMNSGFSSMSSFDRTFKGYKGFSPKYFRENLPMGEKETILK